VDVKYIAIATPSEVSPHFIISVTEIDEIDE